MAVRVTDDEMLEGVSQLGATEGVFAAPEGGACLPALRQLLDSGAVGRNETVVMFNTGSGIKYMEAIDR